MRPEKKIEKLIKNIDIDTNAKTDKAVLDDVLKAFENSKSKKSAATEPNIWRIIMKSPITKLAAAAVIIIAVVLSITILEKSVTPAYAIEQTIEAMRKVTTAHCIGATFKGDRFEIWITINSETGANEQICADMPELKIVASPNETYIYDKKKNSVSLMKGNQTSSDVRFGRFIEDMVDIAISKNAKIEINKVYDTNRAKQVILLVIETDKTRLESKVDPETKLPMSLNLEVKGQPQSGQIGQSIDEIYYDSPLPEGIFEFKIPEGAEVREQ
jgi:outer membrane lipoprotein-sorting protein